MYRSALLLAIGLASTFGSVARSQEAGLRERTYAALNFAGRFTGWGWSRGGYHAAVNGQFPAIRARHPASAYASSGLQYPYSPHYQPMRPVHTNYPMPSPYSGTTPTAATPQPAPELPQAPVGPAPTWLKPYLKESGDMGQPESVVPRQNNRDVSEAGVGDAIPSRPEGTSPFRFENELPSSAAEESLPNIKNETSPSDLLNTDDDDLLIDDDDDLLLHNSHPRRPAPTANRYRQASARVYYHR